MKEEYIDRVVIGNGDDDVVVRMVVEEGDVVVGDVVTVDWVACLGLDDIDCAVVVDVDMFGFDVELD